MAIRWDTEFNAGVQALDGLSDIIVSWLDDDKGRPRKQRHTGTWIYDRLVDEYGYTGSYKTAQRFMNHHGFVAAVRLAE